MTSNLVSKINEVLRKARVEEIKYAKENNVKPEYSKADAVIQALKDVLGINLGPQKEEDIRNSIQQKITMKERNAIIEKRAKSARFRTGIVSLIAASFIGGAASTKAITDVTTQQQNKYATEATLDVSEYGLYVDEEGNIVEEDEGEYTLDKVEVNGITNENKDGRKSFIASLYADGVKADYSEIVQNENKEAAIDSAMATITSPEDVKDCIAAVVESEYNEVNHDNINVSSVYQETKAVSVYIDDEGVARFSNEETEETQTITSIKTVDENGNTAVIKYAQVGDKYVRVYEEGEESKGDQSLNSDVIYLIQQGLVWSDEFYNENTLYTVDENGQKITKKDENGEEVHPCDLTKEDFRTALEAYKTRKIQEEIENTYIQNDDSEGIEPGD